MKKKLKICLIGPFPPPVGGMSIQAEKLYRLLKKEGLLIKAIDTYPDLKFFQSVKGVRTIIRFGILIFKLISQLKDCDTAFIFTCSYQAFFLTTFTAVLISRLYRIKIIINYHGGKAANFLNEWKFFVRPIFKMAHLILVPSAYLHEVFKEFCIDSKVVPNIIDLKQFQFKLKKKIKPKLLVTRHLEKLYNIPCIIKAFQIVKNRFPDSILGIVGSGPEENTLKEFGRKKKLTDIKFYGFIPHNKLSEIYKKFDIFVNASNADNFPVAIMEAFASGLPIVTSAAGGIPYIVEHGKTGFMVELNNHKQLAENIIQLVENPSLALKLAQNARKECEKYTWEAIKNEHFDIWIDNN